MIYGRWGQEVEVVRLGTLEDVERLDGRKPDAEDRKAVEQGGYVVTRNVDDGKEVLHHLAYMRATGGFGEIMGVLDKLTGRNGRN